MAAKKKKKVRKKPNVVAKDLVNPDGKYRMRVEKQKKGTGSYDRKSEKVIETTEE